MRLSRPLTRWLPRVLVLLALVDLAARFVPLDLFAFRAWEPMSVGNAATGPFRASARYFNPWAFGDLPRMLGRADLRQFHPELFSTDEFGFRNPPGLRRSGLPVAAMVNGNSFVVGCGLSDDQTLSALLGAALGQPVYNLAGGWAAEAQDVVRIARTLNLSRRLDIHVVLDRYGLPPAGLNAPLYASDEPEHATAAQRIERLWDDLSISRTRILLNKQVDAWRNPSPGGNSAAVVKHLPDGRETAMFIDDVTSTYAAAPDATYLPWLRQYLATAEIDLLVVLVPNKYTVYEPLLDEADPLRGPPRRIDEMEAYLKGQGVAVLNLATPLREHAAREMRSGRLIFAVDDSHWNAEGVRLAAEKIAERILRP